ncbi:MAG TPA: 23S rRNA (adenine(2503)-C(2))-methyltransferase RlmN [Gammaproteobacteria bacterium]|nr:23S rRNA (adenine(2503)-C(2))-methyltransferase RlmN [Gammaproteobacteria bacterium]
MAATPSKTNLLGLERPELEKFFSALGAKPFHARQVMQWMYQRGVADFEAMTDLGKSLRTRLKECAAISLPPVFADQLSADGTRKWLLGVDAFNSIETVFIPEGDRTSNDDAIADVAPTDFPDAATAVASDPPAVRSPERGSSASASGRDRAVGDEAIAEIELAALATPATAAACAPPAGRSPKGGPSANASGRYRGTLCISSQVGCAMNCSFCATGKQGFNRNLTSAEIIAQVLVAQRALGAERPITNVVFMGMGEPLANYRNVLPVLRILLDDFGYGLSKRRVTVSTSGLVPNLDKLARDCDVALAVSLHAPDDALRDELVPINQVHPLAELMAACRRYVANKDRSHVHVTFEYVMLEGVNDNPEQARALAALVRDIPCKVNLIPFNSFPGTNYRRSPQAVIDRFGEYLWRQGIVTITRRTRGEDIDAACGQLAGQVQDRIRRAERRPSSMEALA